MCNSLVAMQPPADAQPSKTFLSDGSTVVGERQCPALERLDRPRKNRDDPPPTLVRPDPTSGSGGSRSGEGLELLQTLLYSDVPQINAFSNEALEEFMGDLDESDSLYASATIELNPWPFFWVVVSAWIWYGALYFTHVI
jgi:hypothetical protein